MSETQVQCVLSDDKLASIVKICRAIGRRRGHVLLSGVSGVEAHDIVGICAALAQRAITIWAITK